MTDDLFSAEPITVDQLQPYHAPENRNYGQRKQPKVDDGLFSSDPIEVKAPEPVAPEPAKPAQEHGFLEEAKASFMQSLLAQNPTSLGQTIEMGQHLAGVGDGGVIDSAAQGLQNLGKQTADSLEKPQFDSWSKVHGLGQFFKYLVSSGANAAGSMLPTAVTSVGGAAAGGALAGPVGATVGGIGGAVASSAAMNMGPMYQALKDAGMDKDTASKWAIIPGAAITALDATGDLTAMSKLLGRDVKKDVMRGIATRIAQEAAKGMTVEGTTEMVQQMIQDAAVSLGTGKAFATKENAIGWLDNFVGGAVAGGAAGAIGGVRADKPNVDPNAKAEPALDASAVADQPGATPPPTGPTAENDFEGLWPGPSAQTPADPGAPGAAPSGASPILQTPEAALLRGSGLADEDIMDLAGVPAQFQAEVEKAKAAGTQPVPYSGPANPALAPNAGPSPGQAETAPGEPPLRQPSAGFQTMGQGPVQPGPAIWSNKDHDLPVNVMNIEPRPGPDGRTYARVERNGQVSFLPVDELQQKPSGPPTPANVNEAPPAAPAPFNPNAGIATFTPSNDNPELGPAPGMPAPSNTNNQFAPPMPPREERLGLAAVEDAAAAAGPKPRIPFRKAGPAPVVDYAQWQQLQDQGIEQTPQEHEAHTTLVHALRQHGYPPDQIADILPIMKRAAYLHAAGYDINDALTRAADEHTGQYVESPNVQPALPEGGADTRADGQPAHPPSGEAPAPGNAEPVQGAGQDGAAEGSAPAKQRKQGRKPKGVVPAQPEAAPADQQGAGAEPVSEHPAKGAKPGESAAPVEANPDTFKAFMEDKAKKFGDIADALAKAGEDPVAAAKAAANAKVDEIQAAAKKRAEEDFAKRKARIAQVKADAQAAENAKLEAEAAEKQRRADSYRSPTDALAAGRNDPRMGEPGGPKYGTGSKYLASRGLYMFDGKGWFGAHDPRGAPPVPKWLGRVQKMADVLAKAFDLPPTKIWVHHGASYRPDGTMFEPGITAKNQQNNISIKATLSEFRAITTLLHEIGHSIDWFKLRAAPKATQEAVVAAYKRYRASIKGSTLAVDLMPLLEDIQNGVTFEELSPESQRYLEDFHEWFAEQTRTWLTTKRDPKTLVEKFFKGIADHWKALYARMSGKPGTASEVDKFLQALWDGKTGKARNAISDISGNENLRDLHEINSRQPTSKKFVDKGDRLQVTLDAMREGGAEAFDKNMRIVRTLPGFKFSSTDVETTAREFIDQAAENLVWLHDQMPEAMRERALRWYDGAHKLAGRWAKAYGIPRQNIAAVIAALSPGKDWHQNVSMAERLIDIKQSLDAHDMKATTAMKAKAQTLYKNDPEARGGNAAFLTMPWSQLPNDWNRAAFIRLYDETHHSPSYRTVSPEGNFVGEPKGAVAWQSFPNIIKALRLLDAPDVKAINALMGGGHKIRSFYNNIISPNDERGDVTIDTHAVNAALLRALGQKSVPVANNFGNSIAKEDYAAGAENTANSAITGVQGLYALYREAYNQAAERLDMLPRQLQSIAWEAVRGLWSSAAKRGGLPDEVEGIWARVGRGELTRAQAREEILELTGGVDAPAWVDGRGGGGASAEGNASYARERSPLKRPPARGGPAFAPRSNESALPSPGFGFLEDDGQRAPFQVSSLGRGAGGEVGSASEQEGKDAAGEQPHPARAEDFRQDLAGAIQRPGWAIVTATREAAGTHDHAENLAANAKLRQELEASGVPFEEVTGTYAGEDQGTSFLVFDEDLAKRLGEKYGQESVLTHRGLEYTDGSGRLTPSVHDDNEINGTSQAFQTRMADGQQFSMGLDFGESLHDQIDGFHGTPHVFPKEIEVEHLSNGKREWVPVGDAGIPDHIAKGIQENRIAVRELPHGKFRLEKIGTGEGAQVYGWGLYFAERKGIAKNYRDALQKQGQKFLQVGDHRIYDADDFIEQVADANGTDAMELPEKLGAALSHLFKNMEITGDSLNVSMQRVKEVQKLTPAQSARIGKMLQTAGVDRRFTVSPGSLYKVKINRETEHFLHHDLPLNEQPQYVQDALDFANDPQFIQKASENWSTAGIYKNRQLAEDTGRQMVAVNEHLTEFRIKTIQVQPFGSDRGGTKYQLELHAVIPAKNFLAQVSGQDYYRDLSGLLGSDQAASMALRERGIAGIRYADSVSRNETETPTYNYVLFDDADVEITEALRDQIDPTKMSRMSRQNSAAAAQAGLLPDFERPSDPTAKEVFNTGLFNPFSPHLKEGWEGVKHVVQRYYQDNMIDIQATEAAIDAGRAALGKRPMGLLSRVYQLASLFQGKAARQMEILTNSKIKPLLQDMAKIGFTPKQLDQLLIAMHAHERNASMRAINPNVVDGSGMSDGEAANIIAAATPEQRHLAARAQAVTKATALYQWEKGLISVENAVQFGVLSKADAVSSGVLTQAEVNAIPDPWKFYVPLRGWEGEIADGSGTGGTGFNVAGKEFKRAFGRDSRSDGPLAYIFNDAARAIVRGEKNEVGIALYRLVVANPNPEMWAIDRRQKQMRINAQTGLVQVVYAPNNFSGNQDHVITVKIGGKERHIEIFHAGFAEAFKALGNQQLGPFLALTAKLNRYLSMINTSLAPEWFVSNIIRDLQTAMVQISDHPDVQGNAKGLATEAMKNWLPAMKGALKALFGSTSTDKWTQAYHDYEAAGGKVNWVQAKSVEEYKSDIESLFKDFDHPNALRRARMMGELALSGFERFNGAMENAIRLAAFQTLVDRGLSHQQAASVARELTVNFNRRGQAGPVMNSLFLFFNATVQGNVRLFQSIGRSHKTKALVGTFIALGIAEALVGAATPGDDGDDDWYENIPQFKKEKSLIIPGKWVGWTGQDPYIALPIPYGLNVFKTLGMSIGRAITGHISPLKAAADSASAVVSAFNPLSSSNLSSWTGLAQMASPTFLDPVVNIATNTSDFGTPIHPANDFDQRPASEQTFRSSSQFAQNAAQTINALTGGDKFQAGALSPFPGTIDYVLNYFGGGLSRTGLSISNLIAKAWSGEDPLIASDIPFVRGLTGYGSDDRAMAGGYYDTASSAKNAAWQLKQRAKVGDTEGLDWLKKEREADLKMAPFVKGADKQLANLKKQEAEVRASTTMDDDTRQQVLKTIQSKRLRVQAEVQRRKAQLMSQE